MVSATVGESTLLGASSVGRLDLEISSRQSINHMSISLTTSLQSFVVDFLSM
jgi:hypothetical protein